MTAIVLALNRIQRISIRPKPTRLARIFSDANKDGRLSVILAGILGLALLSYVASLFVVFQLGFSIQEAEIQLEGYRRELADTEFRFQQISSQVLLPGASEVLASMEKVTSVKYITEDESVALHSAR